jgi:hypothetical protein
MSISKQDLIKLGFGSTFKVNSESQFIDDEKITHKSLQNVKLDIINIGTLKNPELELILKNKIESKKNSESYQTYHIPIEFKKNYTNYKLEIPLIGQLSYFFPDEYIFYSNNYDYFQQFYKTKSKIINLNKNETFIRTTFTKDFSNSKILTGEYNQKYNPNLISGFFTGSDFANSTFYRAWTKSNTSGAIPGNPSYNGFYLSYPSTLQNWQYNAYNCDTKIAPIYNYLDTNQTNSKNLNGIILISTGNGQKNNICYISPHGIHTGYQNTLVYNINTINKKTTTINTKISSGIKIPALTLGSEYYSGDIFPKTGIYNFTSLDKNQHLTQNIPIKDTLFYKFYTGLYTGSKTFNTGTWNGIIPAYTNFTIELISTELNKKIGTHNQFHIVYSGFGTDDALDQKINYYIRENLILNYDKTSFNSQGKVNNTNVEIINYNINTIGRGYGNNINASLDAAKKNARYNISNKIRQIIKNNIPELIIKNKKYKKLQNFLKKIKD